MGDGTAMWTVLDGRGVVAVAGDDRVPFLQGLVSNDVRDAAPDRALYTLFLTAQGKFLHDFFLTATADALVLDVEAARRADLLRRLKMYKLRSKVTLEDRNDDHIVVAAFGADALARLGLPDDPGAARPFAGGVVYTDPRLAALGARALLPGGGRRDESLAALAAAGLAEAPAGAYDRLRLELGVPDGSRDLEVERAIPLENNLDELRAISWDKGCYMGQELTARTRYRALIKKRLTPVRVEGPLPAPGTPVTLGERTVGEVRGGEGALALALLRIEDAERAAAEGEPLRAGESTLLPAPPAWRNN